MRALILPIAALLLLGQQAAAGEGKSGEDKSGGVRQEGQASYFNRGQDGHSKAANGEPVDANANTAASRNLPLGTEATVTNKATGQSTDVHVNDRGPTRNDRMIDLSKKAAGDIGMSKSGTAPVTVEADPAKQTDPKVRQQLESRGGK